MQMSQNRNSTDAIAYPGMTFGQFNDALSKDLNKSKERLEAAACALGLTNIGHIQELKRIKNGHLKILVEAAKNWEPNQELAWYFNIFKTNFPLLAESLELKICGLSNTSEELANHAMQHMVNVRGKFCRDIAYESNKTNASNVAKRQLRSKKSIYQFHNYQLDNVAKGKQRLGPAVFKVLLLIFRVAKFY
jgi:hypothetical protein